MTKRAINTLSWPYIGIALYAEMVHICVELEGFVYKECYDMYLEKFVFCPVMLQEDLLSPCKLCPVMDTLMMI